MGLGSNVFGSLKKGIPILAAKVGSLFLIFIIIGMFAGFYFAANGYSPYVLLLPLFSLAVMWYKLDEGLIVFIVLLSFAYFFPEFFLF